MGSTRPSKSDAGVKLGVPTSSRTSLPARIDRRVATALQPYPTLRPDQTLAPREQGFPVLLALSLDPERSRLHRLLEAKPSGGHREEGLGVACEDQVGIRGGPLF